MPTKRRLTLASATVAALMLATCAWGATLRQVDDTTLSGELTGLANGHVTLTVKSAGKTTQKDVAMSDIVQIVLRDMPKVAAAPVSRPPPPPQENDAGSPGVFSTLMNAVLGSGGDPQPVSSGPSRRRPPASVATSRPTTMRAAATQTAGTPRAGGGLACRLVLSNGDRLHAQLDRWTEQKLQVRLQSAAGEKIELPSDQVAELWLGSDSLQRKAGALPRQAGPEDVAFVRKDAEVVAVKGLAVGIEGDSLLFRFDEQERKIATSKLVGILFGGGRPATPQRFHQRLRLDGDDQLSGSCLSLKGGNLLLQTTSGAMVPVPLKSVYTIDFLQGRVVYLTDLKPARVEQIPYFGRVIPWRADASLSGGPLQLLDGKVDRGIAVHSRCVLQYDIEAGYQRFQCRMGFEQPAGKQGRAAVRVLGNGKVLYDNSDARGDQPPVKLDLDVAGVNNLTLEVGFGKEPEVGGRVIWANAKLLRAAPLQ